jgi:hypothetical protein
MYIYIEQTGTFPHLEKNRWQKKIVQFI